MSVGVYVRVCIYVYSIQVCTALSSLQHLKTLDLSGNDCGDTLLAQIASSATHPHLFQHLTSLNLSGRRDKN